MFAFPAMYPAAFVAATGVPLLLIIAITLIWLSGSLTTENQASLWCLMLAYYGLFAWLAVRCHRMVLGALDVPDHSSGDAVKRVAKYFGALAAGSIAKSAGALLLIGSLLLVSVGFSRYVPATANMPLQPPAPDPDIQRMIDLLAYVVQIPFFYLLARLSPMLPALALGREWSPAAAWQISRGNGWRLVLVVFLLPWAFHGAVGVAAAGPRGSLLVACLAIATAVFAALGIIALSLAYRELQPEPAPQPTPPPA
jgi:hypothetical protein